MRLPQRSSKAFTLIELIVVIVILGILALIAIPTFGKVIGKSQDESTLTSLRAIARNAQALKALDQAGAWGSLPADAIGEVNQAATAGTFAAAMTAILDDGTKNPSAGQVTYLVKGDGVVVSMLSGSKKICVVGFNSTAMGSGTCQLPVQGATTSVGSALSDGASSVLPVGTSTSGSSNGGQATLPTGSIDSTYGTGTGSFKTVNYAASKAVYPAAAASASDGSIYLAGYWGYNVASGNTRDGALWKFKADGQLDTTFANQGMFIDTATSTGGDSYRDVKVAPDGTVLALHYVDAGGTCRMDAYSPSGTLTKTALLQAGANCTGFAVDSKGRVLLADSVSGNAVVKRFNVDLTPDTSFGINGVTTLSVPAGTGGASTPLAYVDSQDRPVISTSMRPPASGSFSSAVGRLTVGGAMDTTFNSTGWSPVQNRPTGGNGLRAFVSDTRIIQAAGGTGKSVFAYTSSGSLAADYGTNGSVTPAAEFVNYGTFDNTGQAYLPAVSSTTFSIARITAKGQVDTTFGTSGGTATIQMDGPFSLSGLVTSGTRLFAFGAQGTSLGVMAIK